MGICSCFCQTRYGELSAARLCRAGRSSSINNTASTVSRIYLDDEGWCLPPLADPSPKRDSGPVWRSCCGDIPSLYVPHLGRSRNRPPGGSEQASRNRSGLDVVEERHQDHLIGDQAQDLPKYAHPFLLGDRSQELPEQAI